MSCTLCSCDDAFLRAICSEPSKGVPLTDWLDALHGTDQSATQKGMAQSILDALVPGAISISHSSFSTSDPPRGTIATVKSRLHLEDNIRRELCFLLLNSQSSFFRYLFQYTLEHRRELNTTGAGWRDTRAPGTSTCSSGSTAADQA